MASDWNKIRHDLDRDPKLLVMGRLLFAQCDIRVTCHTNVTPDVTPMEVTSRDVTETYMVLGGLNAVWSAISRVIDEENFHPFLELADLDRIAKIKGFGKAMQQVGWVQEISGEGLVFPNFQEFNTPHKARTKGKKELSQSPAAIRKRNERERAVAERQQRDMSRDNSVTCHTDVTRDNPLEKRREEEKRKEIKPPPPLSPPLRVTPSRDDRDERKRGEEELLNCGVKMARDAATAAFAAGATAADIVAICDHFRSRPGAWEAGALYRRVINFQPGEPASESWPPPDPKYERDHRLASQSQQAAREAAERETQRIRDERVKQARETRHGPKFDALARSELVALINQLFDGVVRESHLARLRKDEAAYRQSKSTRGDIFLRLDQVEGITDQEAA